MNPEIIYEDQDFYICYKPVGMATQTASVTRPDMVSYLRNVRASQGQDSYICVIHRLDQPVEGLVVFAKNKKAAANLSNQVQAHTIEKHYLCIVTSEELCPEGVLEDYLVKDMKNQMAKVVTEADRQSKLARLRYKEIETKNQMRLLEIALETGRFHQIRCQLANQDAPILGDRKYGGDENRGLCLASYKLGFTHPRTGKRIEYAILPKGEKFQEFKAIQGNGEFNEDTVTRRCKDDNRDLGGTWL